MGSVKEYFSSLGSGIVSLLKGLQVTGKEFVTPKITERYPEDREIRHVPDRFRATLQFKYDPDGRHHCVACGICERNCPNGTITVETKMVETPDGKKKRKLDKYLYDLGSCTFCQLCVSTCPHDAIEFNNDFEQAVFTRAKLVKQLNDRPEVPDPEPTPEEIAKAKAAREAALAAAKAKAAAAGSAPVAMPSDAELEKQALEKAGGDPEKAARIKEALIKAAKLKAEREAAKAAAAPAAPAAAAQPQTAAEKAMAAAADDPEKAARIKAALEKAAKLKAEREAAKAAASNNNAGNDDKTEIKETK